MPFNPNQGTVHLIDGEVSVHLTWLTTSDTIGKRNEAEITGELRFRGRQVNARSSLGRTCHGSDVGSLVGELVTMGYREFSLDAHDMEVVFRPSIREIRDKLAGDYGIT